jgi:hypothetical protein
MPTNWADTPKKESAWERAKKRVRAEYPEVSEGSNRFYKLTMSIAQNMAGEKTADARDLLSEAFGAVRSSARGMTKTQPLPAMTPNLIRTIAKGPKPIPVAEAAHAVRGEATRAKLRAMIKSRASAMPGGIPGRKAPPSPPPGAQFELGFGKSGQMSVTPTMGMGQATHGFAGAPTLMAGMPAGFSTGARPMGMRPNSGPMTPTSVGVDASPTIMTPKTAGLPKHAISVEMLERALAGARSKMRNLGVPVLSDISATTNPGVRGAGGKILAVTSPSRRYVRRGFGKAIKMAPAEKQKTRQIQQDLREETAGMAPPQKFQRLSGQVTMAHEKAEAQAFMRGRVELPQARFATHAHPSVIEREGRIVKKLEQKYPGFGDKFMDMRREEAGKARARAQELPNVESWLPPGSGDMIRRWDKAYANAGYAPHSPTPATSKVAGVGEVFGQGGRKFRRAMRLPAMQAALQKVARGSGGSGGKYLVEANPEAAQDLGLGEYGIDTEKYLGGSRWYRAIASLLRRARGEEQPQASLYLKGAQKEAQSDANNAKKPGDQPGVVKTFLAGMDPTGRASSSIGLTREKSRLSDMPATLAGGALTGAAILPSATLGVVRAGTEAIRQRGGIGARALAGAKGFASGVAMPYKMIGSGIQATRALQSAQRSPMIDPQAIMRAAGPAVVKVDLQTAAEMMKGKGRNPLEYIQGLMAGSKEIPQHIRDAAEFARAAHAGEKIQATPGMQQALAESAQLGRKSLREGLAVLGTGGAIQAASSGFAYTGGRATREQIEKGEIVPYGKKTAAAVGFAEVLGRGTVDLTKLGFLGIERSIADAAHWLKKNKEPLALLGTAGAATKAGVSLSQATEAPKRRVVSAWA